MNRDKFLMETSRGNHKIGKDTVIFSMTSATDCPSKALGLCKVPERCYAMKSERRFKASLPYKRRQAEYWDTHGPEAIAVSIRQHLYKKYKEPVKYVRFNEAGDFRSQEDVEKLIEVAKLVPELHFYGFTSRSDLNFTARPSNLTVNGSSFMLDNNFMAVPKEDIKPNDVVCPGDCRTCDMCKTEKGLLIKVKYH